jgi:hypothetical protein
LLASFSGVPGQDRAAALVGDAGDAEQERRERLLEAEVDGPVVGGLDGVDVAPALGPSLT